MIPWERHDGSPADVTQAVATNASFSYGAISKAIKHASTWPPSGIWLVDTGSEAIASKAKRTAGGLSGSAGGGGRCLRHGAAVHCMFACVCTKYLHAVYVICGVVWAQLLLHTSLSSMPNTGLRESIA